MKIAHAQVEEVRLILPTGFSTIDTVIEHYARICYRSQDRIKKGSDVKLVTHLVNRGHHAMLEFCDAAVIFSCDRGMSHEIVRHRLASFAQTSTRYCDHTGKRFGGEITVIEQPSIAADQGASSLWTLAMEHAEQFYKQLRVMGIPPEEARSVLPIGLQTQIAIKANIREWLHILELRCSSAAHPIIRRCARDVLKFLYWESPAIFGGLYKKYLGKGKEE